MTVSTSAPTDPDLVRLAKAKLPAELARRRELDRVTRLLHLGERVVTLGHGLCRAGHQEQRALIVLTDERLICLDSRLEQMPVLEFRRADITSVESGATPGLGDARRGKLTLNAGGVATHFDRVRPWECAAEIAEYLAAAA